MPSVITANELRSGVVVYLGHDGRWVPELRDAIVADGDAALKALEADAAAALDRCQVTAVYAMAVRLINGQAEPVSVREKIRAAHAPTI